MWVRRKELEKVERRMHEEEARQIWLIVRIAQIRKEAEQELARIERDGGEAGFAERVLKLAQEAVDG